ncbi:MAG: elongation factor Ts [Gammaproteobacteria bacterium]|nr:elongation factor Ts [Gammaproteobacteria bacterium]MDE2024462.1 elongation factor Ts [Gammaproteobacteria bacterium]MDE2140239.1 elongation factor Ts [Gammaproteobacteria bacterium]
MTISASLVKELRARTGAGMMECKKALAETGGDLERAVAHMRKAGLAKADKKAGRIAAEGRIAIAQTSAAAAMVEVNCETDFVANGEDFKAFATQVAQALLEQAPQDLAALATLRLADGHFVDTARRELVAKIGENVSVRRATHFRSGATLGSYLHGVRIGVLVELQGGDTVLARDVAMHVAASRPLCVSPDQVPAEVLDKEREIIRAQSADSGKPEAIIEKMVEGRLRKYLAEITLLGQPFVKEPEITVDKLLARHGAKALRFARFEVGEGIEKKQEDFAAEVKAQAAKTA